MIELLLTGVLALAPVVDEAPPEATPTPQADLGSAEAPAEPQPDATTEPPSATGLQPIGGLQQDPGRWVPNNWPVQQTCDFLTVQRQACLTLGGEIFTGYRYTAAGGEAFNEFVLDRGELGTGLTYKPLSRIEAGLVLGIESVRSAGPGSLIGIDGDSLIVRLLETYGHLAVHTGPIDIGARVGLVPERWIQQAEKGLDTRGLHPLPSDNRLFFDRSDLGATLTVSRWKGLVELDLQLVNGEGRAQKELNPGKNTAAVLVVRPLRKETRKGPLTLAVLGSYRDGSQGIASLRNHRGAAGVTFASPWAYAGVEYVHALGYNGRPGVTANTLGLWASGHLVQPWLGLALAYARTQPDLTVPAGYVDLVNAAVFSDLFGYLDRNRRRLRLYAGYQYEGYGEGAGPVPGTPAAATAHRFVVQLQARGVMRLW